MTNREHKQLESKIKKATKEVSESRSKAKSFLKGTGFYTEKGNLKRACR